MIWLKTDLFLKDYKFTNFLIKYFSHVISKQNIRSFQADQADQPAGLEIGSIKAFV